ncbi:hypothetical protein C0Q70_19870 [Pomacea canaliculata]|uniref:Ig-like domain-containing protein n=1 Tax=Pomacea canaliculata TaxID=400727 RepID=A0A2T7NE14_POMCA|nr:hypothetical protein C0Q70_19870 [Pomacea canaliculata]
MSATVTYDKGQTAELFCSVTDLGDRTVTWRKLPNRNPLTIGPTTWVKDKRVHIEHVPNSSQWNLIIENVNASDAGTYECKVSARGTPFVQKVILEVKGIEISGRNFLKQGEDVHLQCNATMVDVNVDNLEWLKDGKPIADIVKQKRVRVFTAVSLSPQLTGSISSSLEIDNARVNDSGVYVCRSTGRSQLAGVKLEIKPDTNNSKRGKFTKLN